MKSRYSALMAFIVVILCVFPSSTAIASDDDQNTTKDAAQLKIEAFEAEMGEEGMQEVEDYLELQASLPAVVKASPYSYIAFAATDKEGQLVYMTAIDESDLSEKKKKQLKADLQDIWGRYPDGFVVSDNLVLRDVSRIMEKRFAEREGISLNNQENGTFTGDNDRSDPEAKQSPGFGFQVSVLITGCVVLFARLW